jgi:hypothetical protein
MDKIDIIGNNPQISPITQIENFQEKIRENLCNLRIIMPVILITDKVCVLMEI